MALDVKSEMSGPELKSPIQQSVTLKKKSKAPQPPRYGSKTRGRAQKTVMLASQK